MTKHKLRSTVVGVTLGMMQLSGGHPTGQSIQFICSSPNPSLGMRRPAPPSGSNPQGQIDLHSVGDLRCKWGKSDLTVGFYSGSQALQQQVMSFAREWEQYARVNFRVVPVNQADIRIGFEPGRGYNSYVGSCTNPGRTMNYESDPPRHVVLHEFGHALGLVHEHQSPGAQIPWNRERVYEYYARTQGWNRPTVDANIFSRAASTNYTEYDPKSIMHYPIDRSLTDGQFEVLPNPDLSFLDKTFINVWTWNGPWTSWTAVEDEYLVGNWDNGSWNGQGISRGDKLGVRRLQFVLMSFNFDGVHDFVQGYGLGRQEDQFLIGDWDGDGLSNVAVRRANCVLMDTNFDGARDRQQCFGTGAQENQYLVGDWDGDNRDNIAVRRGNCVYMDTNFDGTHDIQQCFGLGNQESQYLVGDWDGDGRDNLAVRRDNCVLMDTNFDGAHDIQQCFGLGNQESQYLVGDWNGDGRDNLAVRRNNRVLMDFNFDGAYDREQAYGNGR